MIKVNGHTNKRYVSEVTLNSDIPLMMAIELIMKELPDGTSVSPFKPHSVLINSDNKLEDAVRIKIENLGFIKSIEWYKRVLPENG